MKYLAFWFTIPFLFFGCDKSEIFAQTKRDNVFVETSIFKVWYNENYEQPTKLIYVSSNRVTKVNRGTMDFWKPVGIHTSDSEDYLRNDYDKGHLAPAATFSDNMENLKATFSYLNCSLQNQYLNRGEWRLLEEQERIWDDKENLTVEIILEFDKNHIVLPTGGHVPTGFHKHIIWDKSGKKECYYFKNVKPTKSWKDHKIECKF